MRWSVWCLVGLLAGLPSWAAAETTLEGDLLRQERLGFYYFGRGDMFGAMSHLVPVAEAGHALSQYRVGRMEEAATNFAAAKGWYQRAVEQGVSEANHALAEMYANGLLGPKDLATAFSLQREAAERGYAPSMLYVANALERGLGVAADPAEALLWLNRAVAQEGVLALRALIRAHRQERLGLSNDKAQLEALSERLERAVNAEAEARMVERREVTATMREIEKRYLNSGG